MERSKRMLWPCWLGGLVSLAVGIWMWWIMVTQGRCIGMACEGSTFLSFLLYVFATTIGIALLRHFLRLRRDALKLAPGRPASELEPRLACSACARGRLIPGSSHMLGGWAAIGYLAIALGVLMSAGVADMYLTPLPSGESSLDGRRETLSMSLMFLLLGWGLISRVLLLICDHCHDRCYPRPAGLLLLTEPDGNEDQTPAEV